MANAIQDAINAALASAGQTTNVVRTVDTSSLQTTSKSGLN
jgi:hypothetical protein